MKEIVGKEKRIEYIDLLRIIATIGVIIIHVSTQNIELIGVNSFKWNIYIIYDSIFRWCVPIFVMISGTLLLSKKYDFKKLYFKKILRIVTAFIFWAIIYAIMLRNKENAYFIIRELLVGKYHMWFLPMIIGLYIMTPILKKIVESEKITKYFLVVWIVISLILPFIYDVILLIFKNPYITTIINALKWDLDTLYVTFNYTGYFVLGYYLNKKQLQKKNINVIYVMGLVGIILTIGLTIIASKKIGKYTDLYSEYLSLNVFLESIAVYVFAKYNFKTNKIIKNIAGCCFGIYLVHALILEKGKDILEISSLLFNPIIAVPIISISVFIIALVISKILNKIPIINKYVV